MSRAYYNEIDRFACDWLSNLMDAGLITPGRIDDRSIVDVRPDDLAGYERVHFFAGIGGWDHALNLAGWRGPVWTGSCPCQPFSAAGKRRGFSDERHLWPEWFRLIRECSPPVVFGEQVANATVWLDGVYADMEGANYAIGSAILPACSVDAPHRRDRIWFVAHTQCRDGDGRPDIAQRQAQGRAPDRGHVAADGPATLADANGSAVRIEPGRSGGPGWAGARECWDDRQSAGASTLADTDSGHSFWWSGPLQVGWNALAGQVAPGSNAPGTQWRIGPGISLLAHGVSSRVDKLRGFGNAIVPQVAAEFIGAAKDAMTEIISNNKSEG